MQGGFTSDASVSKYSKIVEEGLFSHEAEAISYLGVPPGRILDLGCGAGRTTKWLSDAGFDVVGVDVSRRMVEAAREQINDEEFVHASATHLPFDPESFDHAVFAFNGIDYIPTESLRRTTLEEIRRVLAPQGRLVFCSHNPRYVVGGDPYNPLGYARMVRFWLRNLAYGRLTSRYKVDKTDEGLTETYFITPEEQREQLSEAGFDTVRITSRFWTDLLTFLDPWPYYVAEKR